MLEKLNHEITEFFADLLGFLHVLVIGFLIYLSYQYFKNRYLFVEYIGEFGGHGFLIIFGLLVAYVIFIGSLTTIVSINLNLVRMNALLQNIEFRNGSKTTYSETNYVEKNEVANKTLDGNQSVLNDFKKINLDKLDSNLGLKIFLSAFILIIITATAVWFFAKNSNITSTFAESNNGLSQVTIKQITEYNSKCSNSNGCSWNTLFKAFPLKWEKESEGEYYEISYKAVSKDFEISAGGFKKGPHGDLYISSKYVEGQKKLRKMLESSHSFEKIICRKPSAKEDARNYIYKINNKLLFIFYKIENGNEIVSYFSYEKNPYELIKTNLKDLKDMLEDNCPL